LMVWNEVGSHVEVLFPINQLFDALSELESHLITIPRRKVNCTPQSAAGHVLSSQASQQHSLKASMTRISFE
jgi:hypothetical protein